MVYILVIIISYCLGSISFSVIFGRKFAGIDVREKGSKNAGTTNALRVAGKKVGILTLVCDISKGILAVLIAIILSKIYEVDNVLLLKYIAGFMAILGHTYPLFFEFRGGKGVATSIGVLLMLNWQIGLICLIFALIIILITKTVSIGSILAAILYPILIIFMPGDKTFWTVLISILIALLVIFNHRENIKRIKNRTENKLDFQKIK